MSVAAARWVADFLKAQAPPRNGGPSRALRAVLTVLARDADARTHRAFTSAATIAREFGYEERQVRRMFDALAAHGFRRVDRPGRTYEWHLDPVELSTAPDIWCPGLATATPDISQRDPGHFAARPRTFDVRRRGEGDLKGERPQPPLWLAAAAPSAAERQRVAEILAAAAEHSMRPDMFGTRWRGMLLDEPLNTPTRQPEEEYGT